MLEFFLGLQVWGTPEQVYDKIVTIQDNIYNDAYMAVCSYAGMPYDEAERNMRLFAREVMPDSSSCAPPTSGSASRSDARSDAPVWTGVGRFEMIES